jgi:glycosyltransferase 2 family protein
MRRAWRRTVWLLLGLLVVAGLLYRFRGMSMLGGFNWRKLEESVAHANLLLLLFASGAIYLSYAVRSWRWVRFSRYMGRPTFWNVYMATIMGYTAVFLLGRAGEPVRPLLIARKDHLPVADSFGVYVLERIFDIGATTVLAICALLVLPRQALPGAGSGKLLRDARIAGWSLFWLLLVFIVVLIYFRLHGARAVGFLAAKLRRHGRWRAWLANLIDGFSEGLQAIRSPADLSFATFSTAIHWLVVVIAYFLVLHSFGGRMHEIEFRSTLLVLAFTMVGSVMQLPAVGGGTQVATFLVLTVVFGVEKEPAAAAAIVLWLVTFAVACGGGVPLMIHEGWTMGELRRLAHEEKEAESHGQHASLGDSPQSSGDRPK